MAEQYKIINDFPNYEVSSFGNVKNNKTGRVLKPGIDGHGYYYINLCKDGNIYKKRIHKLVGETFIPNPQNKQCIDHKDNDRLNNNVNNLRYATIKENSMNSKLSSRNTSNFKGVSFLKQRNKYKAYIKFNGKNKHLGYFDKIEDAINARVKKAKEIFGDYMNSCEKEVTVNINIPANTKVKLNINIKSNEEQELEELEKEFNDILNKK
jgi:hypothetical protein